ncbi:FAD-dependent oxidoreductase [Pseudomonas sp. NY15181]|uniref:FAD-dependent oxidoreductase n=1 Tax=Pseudomonas sp. NY15181 TaxID=3400349 RepID=UPI003A842103
MTIVAEQVVVVGAGIAGCTAALEAAQKGLRVTLIDEHPQNTAAMSLDAPYFYGARLAPVLSDEGTIADRVLGSNNLLMECLEAGVEVLTNTCAWGIFVPGPNNEHMESKQIGLADQEKSWMASFDYLIIAAGARDLVLSFPGWHLPGVLGAKAATTLLGKYQALGGNRMLVLGSGNTALQLALQALDSGISVTGIVEPATEALGDSDLVAQLKARGVQFHLGKTIQQALGVNEVSGARLVEMTGDKATNVTLDIECDTICMAYGVIPNIELAAVAGCAMNYDDAQAGWAPTVGTDMQTSVKGIYVVGDAAGVNEAALIAPEVAIHQGAVAANAIALLEGLEASELPTPEAVSTSQATYPPSRWLTSLVAAGGMDVMACQCEEMSRKDLVEVRAPKYVGCGRSSPEGAVSTFVAQGQASQDMLKRMTRVGMGHCQGRRCREHSAMLLADAAGVSLSNVQPGSYRVPVRPLPLNIIRDHEEPASLREHWPTWLHPVDGSVNSAH